MTNQDLANLIFPDVKHDIHYYEEKYPQRNLKEGQVVTRVAPSPTGYMHLGTLFQALIDYILVKNRGGVFYLRNEDTDTKREIEGAVELVIDTVKEEIRLSNIDKNALPEVETHITEYMMEEKKKYGIREKKKGDE